MGPLSLTIDAPTEATLEGNMLRANCSSVCLQVCNYVWTVGYRVITRIQNLRVPHISYTQNGTIYVCTAVNVNTKMHANASFTANVRK